MINVIGVAAGLCVIAAFYVKDYKRCRVFAIGSNFLFIAYSVPLGLWPVVALHAFLLPINVVRLWEACAFPNKATRNSKQPHQFSTDVAAMK